MYLLTPAFVSFRWGCEHEDHARKVYQWYMEQHHKDFEIADSGFFTNPIYPHIGATPDGLVSCSCCGEGVMEVKCPHCLVEKDIPDLVDAPKFCLTSDAAGTFQLRRDHQYYYQVQTQMHVTEKAYCDFLVWAPLSVHLERVLPDGVFWKQCMNQASQFYMQGILPELLGRWFTRHPKSDAPVKAIDLSGTWCYCRREEAGQMLTCQSDMCKINRFHMLCLGLKNVPKRKWFCPECRTLAKALKCTV